MPTATHLPEQFGRFRIVKKLGEGGMGAVYLAEDTQLSRCVALKVPHFSAEDGPEVIERFQREARVAAGIDHPNICAVHDVGQYDGIHYLIMPFIEGIPLADAFDPKQPWPPPRAARLVIRLAVALDAMHRRGIMHRDLKPGNILLRAGDDPVIMDFGLARSVTQSDRMTKTGAVVGTPAYMSPEQIVGDPDAVHSATDIYSLGVIFYQLVSGQLPFPGPGMALYGQILHAELPPPSVHRPELDRELDVICGKAMAKKAAERYATMAALGAALQSYLDTRKPAQAEKPKRLEPTVIEQPPAVAGPGKLRLVCPNCGKKLRVPATLAGKKVRCPGCQQVVEQKADVSTFAAEVPPPRVQDALTPTPQPSSRDTLRGDKRRPRWQGGVLIASGVGLALAVLLLLTWVVGGGWRGKSGTPVEQPSGNGKAAQAVGNQDREKQQPAADKAKEVVKADGNKGGGDKGAGKQEPPNDVPPVPGTNSIGMEMRRIGAGTFEMGSQEFGDEKPRHPVKIERTFFIAAHKTTQGQFDKVLGRKPSYFSDTGGGKDKVGGNTARFPVEQATWFDAVEFCNQLSEKEGLTPCYKLSAIQGGAKESISSADVVPLKGGTGYRLPTEAEWEYCARAGTKTKYSFGDSAADLRKYAWFTQNSDGRTHEVGTKEPNPWKLYDMGGLLYEWCEDVYHDSYNGAPEDGTAWMLGGEPSRRVVRGGSWDYGAVNCRPALRIRDGPGCRSRSVGFRVVRGSP